MNDTSHDNFYCPCAFSKDSAFLAHRESEYVEKNKNGQVNLENEWIGRLGFFGFWFQKGTLGQITTKAMILVGQKIFPSSNITSLEKVYDDLVHYKMVSYKKECN